MNCVKVNRPRGATYMRFPQSPIGNRQSNRALIRNDDNKIYEYHLIFRSVYINKRRIFITLLKLLIGKQKTVYSGIRCLA